MAPSQLPPCFNPTSTDIEQLLSAQCHSGSKNLQVQYVVLLRRCKLDETKLTFLQHGAISLEGKHLPQTFSISLRSPSFFGCDKYVSNAMLTLYKDSP